MARPSNPVNTAINAESAIVLLSGGMDSATVLAVAHERGFELNALTFRYGQRHAIEVDAARAIAAAMGVERHLVLDIDLRTFGGSALTSELEVPKDRPVESMAAQVPVTYVPARNTIFLSYALAWAETLPAAHIFIGVNSLDYSGYPDCRPEYIASFEHLANLATRAGTEGRPPIRLHAPLIDLTKAEIVRLGARLGVDMGLTRSCYDPAPDGSACGRCDACLLRLAGFVEAGMTDPAPYAASSPA
jgi:7-cyano-7-deazaguanine synthase